MVVILDPLIDRSVNELMHRADTLMYENKRIRKSNIYASREIYSLSCKVNIFFVYKQNGKLCVEPKGTSMLDLQQFDLFIRTTGECG